MGAPALSALRDKHVVVTGASRGIGAGLAVALGRSGMRVSAVARSEPELRAVADGAGGTPFVADLTLRDQRRDLLGRIEASVGPIDVLVNNAALSLVAPVWEFSEQGVEDTLALNLLAPIELTRQVLPGMLRRNRGLIVNMSSLGALAVVPTAAPYCATKAGLTHFTATLQRELRGSKVRAMIIQLGEVNDTDMMDVALQSPPIAVASRRMNRVRAVPALEMDDVVDAITAAIAKPRRSLVLPKRLSPMHHIRELPNRLNDLVIAGSESKVVPRR